uniref:Serine/threonine-protein phosphatase 4 regulatory subunit 4 n=1 Tax=Globodera rostochiensis TaxID=31243 RepID=A0A914HIR1_GLORO
MKKVDNSNAVAPGDSAEDAAASASVEITATELQKEQRKSLDALYAAAREEFDLDMSPVDSALKTLRDGREIQKLSVVRNLVELVEGEPEDALHRLLPMIQELLSVEPSNLDMHCEAAVAYKNCIKKKKLQQKCPELSDRFLAAILDNIETQKENVAATAWLESLVDIADCVSMQSVTNMVVPLAVGQADSGKRVQRRVISTRLIEKLAVLVPNEILQRELSPCAQMLCQDSSAVVRTSIAQKLYVLAQSLNNSTDCCTLLLPCIIQLCKDEDPSVREAILSSMAVCLPHFSKDAKKSVLLPLLRKCTEQALILRDASLPMVSRHLGSWLQCLRDILTPIDLRWWLDIYVRILDFAWQQQQQNGGTHRQQQQQQAQKQDFPIKNKLPPAAVDNGTQMAANESDVNMPAAEGDGQQQKQQQLCVACRRMCAYNFPCFMSVFGEVTEVFSGRLLPILEQFCRDSDDEVRSIIASGFHEIVTHRKLVPTTTTTTTTKKLPKNSPKIQQSSTPVPLLLGPFIHLLSSGNSDIVQQLTANLHRILPMLYADISASGSKRQTHLIFTKLDRILVNCNSLMKGSGSWRAHEAYLNGIAVLRNLVKPKDLMSTFVPLLKQEVLTARALPCRIAAAQTLLLMMREFATNRSRQPIIDFFVCDITHHQSCYRRRILLDIVPSLLQYFSREFFIDKFLYAVLKLSTDPIENIRLQLCRTLPKIKQYLVFPNNDESLSSLERVVRELLASEKNALSRQLIQQSACELSRTEMDKSESRTNRAKLAEEKRLWTELEESVDDEEEAAEELLVEKCRKTPHFVGDDGGGSPESGIFFEEDCWLGTSPTAAANRPHQQQFGLSRSATTSCIPHQLEAEVQSNLLTITSSASSEMLSAMAIEPFATSSPKTSRRRPPPPPPKSWRNTTTIRSMNAPKLAIVRPQPQVKVVNQRSSSPMPMAIEEQKMLNKLGGTAAATTAARYRSTSSAPPTPPPKPQLPMCTSSGGSPSPYTAVDSGTSSVIDSIKLKKYRPRDISTTTTMTTRKGSLPGSSTTANASSALAHQSTTSRGSVIRSASAVPAGNDGGGGTMPKSSSPSSSLPSSRMVVQRSSSPTAAAVPLQTSASVTSMPNAGSIKQRNGSGGGGGGGGRRPYGLMRVQSSSSAVERKPAQMSIRVISLT